MIVTIPSRNDHEGIFSMTIEVPDVYPKCGGPRGKPFDTISYDGSRRLHCSGWENPCGHIDRYSDVRNAYWAAKKAESDKI